MSASKVHSSVINVSQFESLFCLNLAKLCADMLATLPQMANTAYVCPIRPQPISTNMRQHCTPIGRQFKPTDVTGNHDLVELWVHIVAVPAPPPSW
jgi:hypothetical protein